MKTLFIFLCICLAQTTIIFAQDTLSIKTPQKEMIKSENQYQHDTRNDVPSESIMFDYYVENREVRLNYNDNALRYSALAGAGTGALLGMAVAEMLFFKNEESGLYNGQYTLTHLAGTIVGAAIGVGISYILFL